MTEEERRKRIEIPEICRVEGHSAVHIDIVGDQVQTVQLDVFEGMRFFERLIIGHNQDEIPHITSRVCAICSTGHVIAAIRAVEHIAGFKPDSTTSLMRELMHLGMIIESNSTHIYALALPDFLGFDDVHQFASNHTEDFKAWTELRNLGTLIQTLLGGRPFHPVNLHVGGFSKYPSVEDFQKIELELRNKQSLAIRTCEILMKYSPPVRRTSEPVFFALVPENDKYGYFGDQIKSNRGFQTSVQDYKNYLKEEAVPYSHAKRSSVDGQPIMVGSMARLTLFSDRLSANAKAIFDSTALAKGDHNTIWNNLAQAIEIVEAFDRCIEIVNSLIENKSNWDPFEKRQQSITKVAPVDGGACGAVECPRGTLYHYYETDKQGSVVGADMVTPSAQNTYRIERDIQEVVAQTINEEYDEGRQQALTKNLETLVRAYDPCNTCATHMVSVKYKSSN